MMYVFTIHRFLRTDFQHRREAELPIFHDNIEDSIGCINCSDPQCGHVFNDYNVFIKHFGEYLQTIKDEKQANLKVEHDIVKKHKERLRDQGDALAYEINNPKLVEHKARFIKKLEKPPSDLTDRLVVVVNDPHNGQVSFGQHRRLVENSNLSRAPSLDHEENKAAKEEVKFVGEIVESKVVDQTSDARGDVVTDLSTPIEMAV
ncbi:hypothetical protein Tco_0503274 [Tanacetum coccineum]